MGKLALISVLGFSVTFGYIGLNFNQARVYFGENLFDYYERAEARLVANSLANMALATLSDSIYWRTGFTNVSLEEGSGGAVIEDNATDTTLAFYEVRVRSFGASGSAHDTVEVIAIVPWEPSDIGGAITANSNVKTLGRLTIDARNHTLAGSFIANASGTKAVTTSGSRIIQGGNTYYGGSAAGADYAPSKPANPVIVQDGVAAVSNSPDAILGHSPGTLKAMAMSGANGSQYATDASDLTLPLSGVTYLELPGGEKWNGISFGNSSGILVVHNATNDALIKNMNSGTFTGVIIADDVEKIHCTIIGAIISLTSTPAGNTVGNGSGQVLYSTDAIHLATSASAGGDGGVTVLEWYE